MEGVHCSSPCLKPTYEGLESLTLPCVEGFSIFRHVFLLPLWFPRFTGTRGRHGNKKTAMPLGAGGHQRFAFHITLSICEGCTVSKLPSSNSTSYASGKSGTSYTSTTVPSRPSFNFTTSNSPISFIDIGGHQSFLHGSQTSRPSERERSCRNPFFYELTIRRPHNSLELSTLIRGLECILNNGKIDLSKRRRSG